MNEHVCRRPAISVDAAATAAATLFAIAAVHGRCRGRSGGSCLTPADIANAIGTVISAFIATATAAAAGSLTKAPIPTAPTLCYPDTGRAHRLR